MSYLHCNAVLVECVDKQTLQEVLSGGLKDFVVLPISETAVLVDPEQAEKFFNKLEEKGQMPCKIRRP